MKICIAANGTDLRSEIHREFTSAPYLLFYDTLTEGITETLDNPAVSIPEGGELQAARLIVSRDIDILLCGKVSPDAGDVLGAGGVKHFIVKTPVPVNEAIDRFFQNELDPDVAPPRGLFINQGSPATSSPQKPTPGESFAEGQDEKEFGSIPPEECVCPSCGESVRKKPGIACSEMQCPRCGFAMAERKKGISESE